MKAEFLVVVAGGVGSRMKSDRPKQFLDLCGEPVIIRTIRQFLAYNSNMAVIISVHRNYKTHMEGLIARYGFDSKQFLITTGGDTRYESVKNGLAMIEGDGVVGIHDAARPFVSIETIRTCFQTAAAKGNAVPCTSVGESMRKISNNINVAVNRNEFKIVQTPQCFHVRRIREAFRQPYSSTFTDDATVMESVGEAIHLVEGNPENIKITSPFDLMVARAICNEQR